MSLTHPPTHCQRCGNGLPPHGTLDKLIMVGDRFFCFLCMHAYAEAAWKNDIHPGGFCVTPQKGKISFVRLSKTTVYETATYG